MNWVCGCFPLIVYSPLAISQLTCGIPPIFPGDRGTESAQQARVDLYGDPLPEGALRRLGTIRWRHEDMVRSLSFSPDSKTILSCAGGTLFVWESATGRMRRKLEGGKEVSRAMALSPDGKTLAATGWTGVIRLWDVATGKELPPLEAKGTNCPILALSSDGALLASVQEEKGSHVIHVWDVRSGIKLCQLPWHYASIYTVAFSPDNRTLAYGGSSDEIYLFDATTGKELHRLKSGNTPACVAFSPDGKTLAATCMDSVLRLWNVETGEVRLECHKDKRRSFTYTVSFSPDGRRIAQAKHDAIILWDAATGKELQTLWGCGASSAIVFSPDGKVLASGGFGQTICLWNLETGKPLSPSYGHQGPVSGVAFAPDNRTLASAGHDNTIRLWDIHTGKELYQALGHSDRITNLFFTPDGRTLISASHDHTIRWWEASTGKEFRRRPVEQTYFILALSPNGKVLVYAPEERKGEIYVWDANTGLELYVLRGHSQSVGRLSFAAEGKILVSAGYRESSIQLWDLEGGLRWRSLKYELPSEVDSHNPPLIAVSPDGRVLACQGQSGKVHLWEVATGKLRRCVYSSCNNISTLAFSPDSKALAIGDRSGTIQIWDVIENKILLRFDAGRLAYKTHPALAFSPDGRLLATINDNTAIHLWPITITVPGERHGGRLPEELWTDLASANTEKAYQAICDMIRKPNQVVLFMKDRLRPTPLVDPSYIAQLLGDLDNEHFAVREKATKELVNLQEQAKTALHMALRSPVSLECRKRIELLLEKIITQSG